MIRSFFITALSLFSLSETKAQQPPTIGSIPLPSGYKRIDVSQHSFGLFLRSIQLKNDKTVYLYNSQKKMNQSAHYAVLNIPVGSKDLQQCADAIMRLRAEYLKTINQPICFADNNRKQYCWADYKQKGWQAYLETVYGNCGTLSLEHQMKRIDWNNFSIGDVIIKGGSPGHAVIIVDIAQHKISGKRIFLLAQSYMPAQDIHILLNTNQSALSPWYSILYKSLLTPEWTFEPALLYSWNP